MIRSFPSRLGALALATSLFALALVPALAPDRARAQQAQGQGQRQGDMASALSLVEQFLGAHAAHLAGGQDALLNDAGAAAPYLVDALAIDGLQAALQFDPVYNAQDASVSGITVAPDPETPFLRGAAQVRVSLQNFGQPQEFVYALVQVPPAGHWQIADIYSVTSGWSLYNRVAELGHDMAASGPEITLQAAAPIVVPGMEEGDMPGDGTAPGGSDLLLILDASGSMWGQIDGVAKITTARQALTGILSDLDPATNVGLMAYGHRREGDCTDTQVLYPVASHDTRLLVDAVSGIVPRGKTPIADALAQAASAMPAADRQASVLLISDGLETCGGDPCAAAEALAARGIETRVHVVGFDLSAEEQAALECIAEKGNGTYYAANDAQSFTEAVNSAVQEAQAVIVPAPVHAPEPAPMPTPAPEPVVETGSETVFEEAFDGPALAEGWQVVQPAEELATLTGEGTLFVSAVGKETHFANPEARNRYLLDAPLPEGDFDLVLDLALTPQTRYEQAWLSIYEAAHAQVGANLWAWPKGCGIELNLSLIRLSGSEEKVDETRFDTNLFDGPFADGICYEEGRARADAILAALGRDGATLRLKRRGRAVTAQVEMVLPAGDGAGDGAEAGAGGGAETLSFETEEITLLRLSGRPGFMGGHWHKAQPGESHFTFDRFAIDVPE